MNLSLVATTTSLLAAVASTTSVVHAATSPSQLRRQLKTKPSIIAKIQEKGQITCGIPGGLNTFLDNGEIEGFDAEYCRAYAAAILGNPDQAKPLQITFAERWEALLSGKVDVVLSSTHTMERDVNQGDVGSGFTFTAPTLYDGLKFGGVPKFVACVDDVDATTGDCADLRICVSAGTSWLQILSDELFPDTESVIVVVEDGIGHDELAAGECNVVAGESPNVIATEAYEAGYTGDYAISTGTFSKEPLGTVTLQDDPLFSDIMNWVNMAILSAEEKGITMDTAADIGKFDLLGKEFENMFIDAIAAVGNYGEIYQRTAQEDVPRAGLNRLNEGGSGLIYSLPFGSLDVEGASLAEDGTISKILQRGSLICGIVQQPGLDDINPETNEWEGFDVDFCRALSAALFSGDAYRVDFVSTTAKERFVKLANGDVDVLSRKSTATLARDILEPTSGVGFTFAAPNFYDGMAFGGVPAFVACAENQDFAGDCSALKICVGDGSTTLATTRTFIPEEYIVVTTGTVIIDFVEGNCNVVAGDAGTISKSAPIAAGYTGEYTVGDERYSKEPLALVTRQDDPQWSDLVFWIVQGLFYAEEAGITQDTADKMPATKLFGPKLEQMFVDSVAAVGNYGELYERTIESAVPRSGLNLVNNDNGPQLYALPGV